MKKQIYVTRNLPDVYLVRDYLQGKGLPGEIRNENLFGAQGEVPVTSDTLPSLWTDEEHELTARELIQIHRDTGGADGVAALDAMHSDASPDAHRAMADLFEAADRLSRGVDGALLDRVRSDRDIVTASGPPFGIDPQVWQRIADLSGQLASAGARHEDDAVVATAAELRDLLRDLV